MVKFFPLFIALGMIIGYTWFFVINQRPEFTTIDHQIADDPDIENINRTTYTDTTQTEEYKYIPASCNSFADPKNNSFFVSE